MPQIIFEHKVNGSGQMKAEQILKAVKEVYTDAHETGIQPGDGNYAIYFYTSLEGRLSKINETLKKYGSGIVIDGFTPVGML